MELWVEKCSVQKGSDRFPPRDRAPVPTVATRRNNLTALSQHYNLFFIAQSEELYVHRPRIIDHVLPMHGRYPELRITPQLAKHGKPGHHDLNRPHCINNIAVADLGDDEILVCALDDGNVAAYYTRVIHSRIEASYEEEADAAQDIRPFFTAWVGASAWGISVHKESRLLAISCNLHIVTVFAFALVRRNACEAPDVTKFASTPNSSNFFDFDREPYSIYSSQRKNRTVNFKFTLPHLTNIPCISFDNSPTDPGGRWLASIDIAGHVNIWDLWLRKPHHQLLYGPSVSMDQHILDVYGWTVLFPDIRAFQRMIPTSEVLGFNKADWWGGWMLDVTDSLQTVRDGGREYGEYVASDAQVNSILTQAYQFSWRDEFQTRFVRVDRQRRNFRTAMSFPEARPMIPPSASNAYVDEGKPTREIAEDQTDQWRLEDADVVPLLVTTNRDVFLGKPSMEPPLVMACNPLAQLHSPNNNFISQLQRDDCLNMQAYIPELGAVAIGSHSGRVLVLSLTLYNNTELAFHIAYTLPFNSQETADERPHCPLLGIAAGPIPGREIPEGALDIDCGLEESWREVEVCRRYRLILTYMDNSILTYEISRQNKIGYRKLTDM